MLLHLGNLLLQADQVTLDVHLLFLELVDLLAGLLSRTLRGGELLQRENIGRVIADRYEPDVLAVVGNDLERNLLGPLFVEGFLGDTVIPEGIAEFLQFLQFGTVILAPGDAPLEFLVFFGEELPDFFQALLEGEGFGRRIVRTDRTRRDKVVFQGGEICDGLTVGFGFPQQRGGTVVHRLDTSRNVNHAKLLQISEELFFFPSQENEVVSGHFTYHTCPSSSSAACLPLTILEDALERFSSSSIYRLILRMASL